MMFSTRTTPTQTLSMSEAQFVLEFGITVGGGAISEHLEVIGHKEAIDHVESLSKKSTAITESDVRNIHNLVCRGAMPGEAW